VTAGVFSLLFLVVVALALIVYWRTSVSGTGADWTSWTSVSTSTGSGASPP